MNKKSITLYGIAQCSTVRQARTWLKENNVDFDFEDMKKKAPSFEIVTSFVREFGLTKVMNRHGLMWRKLSHEIRDKANGSEDGAIEVMCAYPSLIKRPILCIGDVKILGFDINCYIEALKL